jgi:hypothetical protein
MWIGIHVSQTLVFKELAVPSLTILHANARPGGNTGVLHFSGNQTLLA